MVGSQDDMVTALLNRVFERAKQVDEFEFAVAIIPLTRGLPPYGADGPLRETELFVQDMLGLMNAPLEYMARLRLGLMIYVHMMESKPVYEVLSNLLWIIAGGRAVPEPFEHLYRKTKKRRWPPSAKRIIDFLVCQAKGVDELELAEEIEGIFDDALRNAVAHSDYFFHDERFQTDWRRSGSPTRLVNGIPLEELHGILIRGAGFFEAMLNVSGKQKRSYRERKVVMARTGKGEDRVQAALLADEERGLYGVEGLQVSRPKNS